MNSFIRFSGIIIIILFCGSGIFSGYISNSFNIHSRIKKYTDQANFFENRFFDIRLRKNLQLNKKDKDILFVNIDDYSLNKIGTFPFSRKYYARLINNLSFYGAKVIAFDVLFPEKSPSCNQDNPDKELAKAMFDFDKDGKKIILGYALGASDDNDVLDEIPDIMKYDRVITSIIPVETEEMNFPVSKKNFPNKIFLEANALPGFISSQDDIDGIFRSYKLTAKIITFSDNPDDFPTYAPSLAVEAYRVFSGKQVNIKINDKNTAVLNTGSKELEFNLKGEANIRYIGGENHFESLSFADLVEEKIKNKNKDFESKIKDKIIFIGSTSTGAHDLRHTPIDSKMPGVFAHMNVTHMLLNNYFFQPSYQTYKYSLILLFLGLVILLITQYFGIPLLDIAVVVFLICVSYFLDSWFFMPEGYQIKLFFCWLCFVAVYSWNTFLNFQSTSKEKKQIRGAFSRYVAPTIVTEMLKDPDNIKLGGTKKNITCLFSDVRDFTSISEKLSADQLASALNYYMNAMTDLIFESKGTVDKYIGDAIVAIWGAPLEFNDHPQFAVDCAIKMTNKMHDVNRELKRLYNLEFKVGVGLNSGECSVGNMGSDRIFSYTALGDNMNLGARLEGLCKYYGTQIIISEFTLARLNATIKYRALDRVLVKGKNHPVAIFEVLHDQHPLSQSPDLLIKYSKAYQLFLSKNIEEAHMLFKDILQTIPDDKPTQRLSTLCEQFLSTGIPEIDHDVTKMTEK